MTAVKGGDPGLDLNGMVNFPVIDDRLALRAVGFYADKGGYIDNIRRGETNTNDSETYGGRVGLRFTPNEKLTIDLNAYLQLLISDFPIAADRRQERDASN